MEITLFKDLLEQIFELTDEMMIEETNIWI